MRLKVLLLNFIFVLTMSASTASDAEKQYRAGEWAQAEVLYAKLLKSSPSNRVYNHRYGVSLYEQEKNLALAEKHLIKSKRAGITLSAFYLGRVCFLQYKFEDAIDYYTYYLSKSNDKNQKAYTNEQLPKCEQGKEMLERVEDIKIFDKVEVDKNAFFLNYTVNKEAGSFFNNAATISEDSIANNTSIYLTERGDRAFFAKKEDDGNFDLYSKNRLLDQWAEKVPLGNSVNTLEDEAYPFLMSDGIVLYFSSKGHNSFGGYDIYVTRFNANQNSYLPPQQLGMPFNSLGDDILFAIDEYNNVGWFASDRDSEEGRIAIYTFEPNSTIKLLNTDSEEERINAAMITQTTSTVDTSAVVATKPKVENEIIDVERDIYFIVNDTLIYSSLDDFMSEEAQHLYLQYEATSLAYDSTVAIVSEKRLLYSKTLDSNEKASLISTIISLEEKSYEEEEKRDKLQWSTRRIELETINANGGYLKEKPTMVEAPVVPVVIEEKHISSWETEAPKVTKEKISKPFFYDKTLNAYYDQIYSQTSIDKLIEANQMKADAGDKEFLAAYIMKEYNKPVPEENFFQTIYAYDTTLTPNLSGTEILEKVTKISEEAALLFIEANYLSFYTLEGQNRLLLEKVEDETYHKDIITLLNNAAFSLQQADQKIYVTEGVYTTNNQQLSQGNNFLKEGIQLLESTSLTYLKYRYELQNKLKAHKPVPVEVKDSIIQTDTVPEKIVNTDTIARTEIAPKIITVDTSPVAEVEYRIQFGVFSRLLEEADVNLTNLTYYQYSEKTIYKYYSGHYKTQIDAAMGLEEVKNKGFKDAYVVKFVGGIPE